MNEMRSLLLTVIGLLCGMSVSAHDFMLDGIYYKITSSENKTVEVTYRGDSPSYSNAYSGAVIIPESVTYNGDIYSVTSVGNYAFYKCYGLTSVEIPNNVTSIGNEAFYKCDNLKVVLNNSDLTFNKGFSDNGYITYYAEIVLNDYDKKGDFIFTEDNGVCYLQLYIGNELDLELPLNYKGVDYVIGDYALYCSNITSVVIPNSVKSIGDYSFYNCDNLISVAIPNSVIDIGNFAFYDCSNLRIVAIPNSVISIGEEAFRRCYEVDVVFNNSVLNITKGSQNYGYIASSADFVYNKYDQIDDWIYIEENSAYYLRAYVGNAHDLQLPENYKGSNYAIGNRAFLNLSTLTSVTIPNSVISIGNYAFYGCDKLTSVTIPNSVTSIGETAFKGCSSLTSVTIPNSVVSIGSAAFEGCSNLVSVAIPTSVTSLGTSIFSHCSSLTTVTIPNHIDYIGYSFFYDCDGLTSVNLPNGLTSIGPSAFYDCDGLISIVIPNSVERIGDYAFQNCSYLSSVEIPNSVNSIGSSTFANCWELTSVVIPNSVESIGNYAFFNCSGLTSVSCLSQTPPTISSSTFTNYEITLFVPIGAKSAYSTAEYWKNFTNIIELGPNYELNVSNAGYATLYLDYTTEIPDGVEVYTAREVAGNVLKMELVEDVLPANTGVVVKAPAGTYTFAYSDTDAPAIADNLFMGSAENTYIDVPSNSKAFVLSKVDGEVGMYLAKLTDGRFLNNANKAYLLLDGKKLGLSDDELDTSVGGAQLSLRFNFGGATSIDNLPATVTDGNVIYDLYGRKLNSVTTPGLYIVNGKKVWVK